MLPYPLNPFGKTTNTAPENTIIFTFDSKDWQYDKTYFSCSLTLYNYNGTSINVDWGDETIENVFDGQYSHSYSHCQANYGEAKKIVIKVTGQATFLQFTFTSYNAKGSTLNLNCFTVLPFDNYNNFYYIDFGNSLSFQAVKITPDLWQSGRYDTTKPIFRFFDNQNIINYNDIPQAWRA